MKPTIVVVDMQEAFFADPGYIDGLERAMGYINYTVELFRKADRPVVWVQDDEAGEGPDSPGFALRSGLDIHKEDVRIVKHFSNAFHGTGLAAALADKGTDFLVIAGFAAEHCVTFTWNGAEENGFAAALLQHGIAGQGAGEAARVQALRPMISVGVLEAIFADRR